ncbi:thioesterase domain-containing protein [Marinomonas sp. RSW2]|uniref:Thioesterase domain-containing protein n=1 Tax=Marinomonas maritima TaxID=2940935 RepID=A0ABT5WF78_9GAMM|nr:thioesterase domain-containing protein [Marinomonas maritima]MDE8603485.1 thioesterase domain-containing protein [Marinomonas maritima]
MSSSTWFQTIKACPFPALRLFMFPYAGGNARIFNHWAKSIPQNIEVLALQLPGRGERITEQPQSNIDSLLNTLEIEFSTYNANAVPFVFLGHSLGARIAIELTYRFYARQKTLPIHFIASGALSPDLKRIQINTSSMSNCAFVELLKRIGGTPKNILENNELMQLILPAIKADFCLAESTKPIKPNPLPIGATILNGKSDFKDTELQIKHWQTHFSAEIKSHIFNGGHFFINEHANEVMPIVSDILRQLIFDIQTNQTVTLKRVI